jgi:hypothetical protein
MQALGDEHAIDNASNQNAPSLGIWDTSSRLPLHLAPQAQHNAGVLAA